VRTSDSGLQTLVEYAFKWPTVETLFAYTASAFIFSFIYLWSLSDDAGLDFITYFTADRARLSEKPLFFISHLTLLGVYQAFLHLFRDVDRLSLGTAKPQNGNGKAEDGDASVQLQKFRDQLPAMLVYTVNSSIFGILITLIIYPIVVRRQVWKITMMLLRPFYNLPRSNMVPASLPFSFKAILQCWVVGVMLIFAWTAANTAFTLFLAKPPLKNKKPLTAGSKDPNGSLLNGLKNKKLSIKVCSTSTTSPLPH
jgi:nucleoporin NDC1